MNASFTIKLRKVELLLYTIMFYEISCLTQIPINANFKQNNKGIVIKITKTERIETKLEIHSLKELKLKTELELQNQNEK